MPGTLIISVKMFAMTVIHGAYYRDGEPSSVISSSIGGRICLHRCLFGDDHDRMGNEYGVPQ